MMELCRAAIQAIKQSYSPYSDFKVGAALLTKDGKIYTGCNIENASFSATVCAERTAIFKAISEGETEFAMLAIAGGKNGEIQSEVPPCGVCRQVLSEFCDKDFPILLVTDENNFKQYTLGQLLPLTFGNTYIEE